MQQQQSQAVAIPNERQPETGGSGGSMAEAPPKQVALAMDRLAQAARLIADIRLGADRLLEALFVSAQPHQSNKPLHLFMKEDTSIRQHLQDLRSIGRQLEDSGVLNESLRLRSNSWGLHMPLVCPDGAVVAYAWKRQLAGQAGASAVDRTRLALKAFTDQKRRFFPHLDDGLCGQTTGTEPILKKHCGSQLSIVSQQEELSDCTTLSEVLRRLEKEVPNIKISTYQRLDWLKRASLLPSSANENSNESSKEHNFHSSNKIRPGPMCAVAADKVAIIELLSSSVFRVIVSLHPAGSIDPDAVAFFSPDEGGSYVHARGLSVYHVFRHITEHATMALQYFIGIRSEKALYFLLRWICSYQTLFTTVCSKCKRLLSMDRQSASLLPPVHRPYQQFSAIKISTQPISSSNDQSLNITRAYHVGCFSEEV
ncbi:hypothetical protein L1049_008093 [Liquidambar formosana]|uniref:Mediator of RNA polymerase II transcription subunit 27 n=1 Tax=Liquidambar formosana TaxID=63359 RepID=A0AAP0X4C3_LIQFO